jgi:tRNA pseudouridine38-40 synthase
MFTFVALMKKYFYIIRLQFLGFRFHGWQRQEHHKTLQGHVEKTLRFVLGSGNAKVLGSGRTDARVSANNFPMELFAKNEIKDLEQFLIDFNLNLPNDIKALSIIETNDKFNIINNSKIKEYLYFFSFGTKNHPFAAPILTCFYEELDLDLMKKGAALFKGHHWFKHYCTKPTEFGNYNREIIVSEIVENTIYSANFFPKKTYVYRIKSRGFLRNQVRLIMGTLFRLGQGQISLEFIEKSLIEHNIDRPLPFVAPASGLILYDVEFQDTNFYYK